MIEFSGFSWQEIAFELLAVVVLVWAVFSSWTAPDLERRGRSRNSLRIVALLRRGRATWTRRWRCLQ